MVMAQVLYRALKKDSTSAEIHVVAPAWSRPLLTRMPEIEKIIELDITHGELALGKRLRLGRRLRSEQYARAFILPRSFKSAIVPWVAKVPRRIGDLGEMRYLLLTDHYVSNKDKAIPNACNYLRYLGFDADIAQVKREFPPQLNVDTANQQRILVDLNVRTQDTLVACMVGAEYGPSKQWPAEHFAALMELLGEQGIQVCLLGSNKDRPLSEKIQALCRHAVINLCGKTSLTDVVDVLAACRVAISNDSGLMHIAAAVDTPVVAMFGATTPSYTPPLHAKAKAFYLNLECSPCWQRTCQYNHYRCLKDILPSDVCAAVMSRL